VKICPACGLPAPSTTATCAFCEASYPHPAPLSFRLEEHDGAYRWTGEDAVVAVASWAAGMCHVRQPGRDAVSLTLVPMAGDGAVRVAMVDAGARLVSTLQPSAGPATLSTVCDRYEHPRLVVKGDGPTGIHIVDMSGDVVALASRDRGAPGLALDVLVLRPRGDGETVLFGVVLATELLRTGELRPVG